MVAGKQVLIIGPGFIGWNILECLVANGYEVSALVRRKEHALGVETSGATAVLGDINDSTLISFLSAKSDIVFHTAGADHLSSVQAVLDGMSQRARQGQSTIYIHTSGAKVLSDNALGMFRSDKIYRDDRREDVDWVSDDAPHRKVDLTILRAQSLLGKAAKVAIVFPPEIYGYDSEHNRLSIMMPAIARFALKHGYVPRVGEGLSVETQVHVLDLARAYTSILQWMEKAQSEDLLENPYFFCENGVEFSWYEAAKEIANALFKAGVLEEPKAKAVPEDMWGDLFGSKTGSYMGLNCRCRAMRLRALGWKAREKGIWESFQEDELPQILSRKQK